MMSSAQLPTLAHPMSNAPLEHMAQTRPVGLRFLRMASDLVAKRAVEHHLRRKARRRRKPPGWCFACLPCCQDNNNLQEDAMVVEMRINRQNTEVKEASRARYEEIAQLSAEVSHLEQQLRQPRPASVDLEPEGEPSARWKCLKELRTQLEIDLVLSSVDIEQLHKQLLDQRSQIEQARQRSFEALRQNAEHQTRIAVDRQRNALEIAALKRRLVPPNSSNETLEPIVHDRRAASSREANELQEVEAALAGERIAQQKERALLEQELRTQHEKANSQLADPYRIDDELSKQCVNLHMQASNLLDRLGIEGQLLALPPTFDSILDLSAHSEWLQSLAGSCEMLVHRAASASKT